jgi:PPM family protein phosphatase
MPPRSADRGETMVGVHSFSEVGGHRLNEDAFCVQSHPLAPDCWLCFVADGQGGRAGGGLAAQLGCEMALAIALTHQPTKLTDPHTWAGIVQLADKAVATDPGAGFTTFLGLCAYQGRVVGASSGDSAALLVSRAQTNELTARQQKNPPVGCGAAVAVPFGAAVEEPWRVLLMSDGVWKYVGWARVIDVARGAAGSIVISELQRLARLPGSGRFQDDFTVVMLESPAE